MRNYITILLVFVSFGMEAQLNIMNIINNQSKQIKKIDRIVSNGDNDSTNELPPELADWDAVSQGVFSLIMSSTNAPPIGTSMGAYFPHPTAAFGTFIAGRNGAFYMRSQEAGAFTPWEELITKDDWNTSIGTDWNSVSIAEFQLISSETNGAAISSATMGAYFPHPTLAYGTYLAGRNGRYFMRSEENAVFGSWDELIHEGNIDDFSDGDDQTLTLTSSTLAISDGNTINLNVAYGGLESSFQTISTTSATTVNFSNKWGEEINTTASTTSERITVDSTAMYTVLVRGDITGYTLDEMLQLEIWVNGVQVEQHKFKAIESVFPINFTDDIEINAGEYIELKLDSVTDTDYEYNDLKLTVKRAY